MKRAQHRFYKSFMAVCLTLILLLSMLAVTASATDDMTISATKVSAKPGETVDVSVTLDGNSGIWGLRFRVGYDHDALVLKGVKNGTVFTSGEITAPPLNEKEYNFMADRSELSNTTANGLLVTLTFEVKDDSKLKDYPITIKIDDAINANETDVEVNTVNGCVTVKKSDQNSTDKGNQPDTGVSSKLWPYIVLLLASATTVLILFMIKNRKKTSAQSY